MRKITIFSAVAMLFTPLFCYADAEDVVWLTQQLTQMEETYKKVDDTYETTQNQLKEVKNMNSRLHKDLNGLSKIDKDSIGDIFNDAKHLKSSWTWAADDWRNTLKKMSGGDNARYNQLVAAYNEKYPSISSKELSNNYHVSAPTATIYTQAVAVNKTAMAEATYQYDDINKHMEEIQQLTTDINKVTTAKEAADLNSRLVAETAYIQAASLRMQTLLNQQLAERRAAELADQKANIEFASHEIK